MTLTTLNLCPLISIIWVHLQSEQSELILILKLAPLTPCCLIPWSQSHSLPFHRQAFKSLTSVDLKQASEHRLLKIQSLSPHKFHSLSFFGLYICIEILGEYVLLVQRTFPGYRPRMSFLRASQLQSFV